MKKIFIFFILCFFSCSAYADLTFTDGTAIDSVKSGVGGTLTVSFDATEITGGTTWDDGGEASVAWTWNLSAGDPTITFGNDLITLSNSLTVTTGKNIKLGTTTWNSGDGIDGEVIANDTIDDDSIDFTDVTLTDITFDVGSVDTTEFGYLNGVTSAIQTQINAKQATVTEGSLTDSVIISADIKDDVIIEPDLSADNTASDGDVLTYDSTGTNFNWITPNAGTDITADLEEEVTEGSLANSVIISADIKDDTLDSADYAADSIDDEHINWGTEVGQINPADFSDQDIGDITLTTGSWAVEDDSHAHTSSTLSGIDISADTNLTAGDALTLTDDDIDFDGGATPGGSLGGTWASPTIDDLFVKNDANDTMTGTLTADGLTLGADENITLGTSTIQLDTTKADFVFNNDIDIEQTSPHLNFRDSDTNVAYMWHLDSAWVCPPYWDRFSLLVGTDDGTGFVADGTSEIFGFDSNDDAFFRQGDVWVNSARVRSTDEKCVYIENLAAADDNISLGSFAVPVTITKVWLSCNGTCTTKAQISLEDEGGNAMTHTVPTAGTWGTPPTAQDVTANNTLDAFESLAFDVDNAVSPETDEYEVCVACTIQ